MGAVVEGPEGLPAEAASAAEAEEAAAEQRLN